MRQMKDSGIEWINEIPANWKVMPHKYIMHKQKDICEHYNGEDIISLTMNGVIVRDLTAGGKMPTTFDGYQYVEPEDLLMCLFDIDVTPRCVGVVHNYGLTSPAYSRFKVHNGYHNAYYDYLLRFIDDEKVFIHLSKNLRSSLTETDFGAIKTIVPPYDEQKKIADFLDKKCAEIDAVIEKTKATIEEYKQLKQSIITEAVTKGIRGNRPMKDSGIKWIGEFPSEWTFAELKMFCNVNNGKEITNEVDKGTEGAVPVYGSGGVFKYTDDYMYDGTTVMFGRKGTLGKPLFVTGKLWVVDTMYYLTYDSKLLPKFNYYQLSAFDWIPYITQTALPSVVASQIVACEFAFPSIQEQNEITDYLDSKCLDLDAIITKKTALLQEMENYKKSVVYEYVTGKKEV